MSACYMDDIDDGHWPCHVRVSSAESDTVLHHDYSSQVKVPVLAMRAGSDLQTYVDILVPNNAKLTLVKVCFSE